MESVDQAERILALSREARWDFPTSSGRPVSSPSPAWADRFTQDRDSFAEAAIRLQAQGRPELAEEVAANVWRLWVLARDEAKGRAFLAAVLDRDGAVRANRFRALALYGDGLLAFRQGDLVGSRRRCLAALETADSVGDPEAKGLALLGLSRVELSEGEHEQARSHAAASLATLKGLGPEFTQAPLHMLAQATRVTGPLDDAAALFAESLALNRRLGDHGMVRVELHNLGHVELRRGNVDAAERHFDECARMNRGTDDPYDIAMELFNRASVAMARDDRVQAGALMDQARSTLVRAQVSLATDDQREFDDLARRLGP